ncbi:protein suppressor of gene silencing [Datura stramonium]|uniref:Protein suppressor of gene silencing n=1 Tax=Datura stramonium TaxID=4076 RepID=A0ABS8V9H0_DATST|nr:protein suppressor of gene silencing [Datura stramonium]
MSFNSNRRVGKPSNKSVMQKTISKTIGVDEINAAVGDLGFNSDQSDEWFVCSRKSKNKGKSNSSGKKQLIPQNPISESWGNKNSTWGHPDVIQKLGLRNNVGSSNSPVTHDDDVKARESDGEDTELNFPHDDSDEDEIQSDEDFDDQADVKEMSYEARKQSPWFKKFFDFLDKLIVTKIDDPERQWHCPACKGSPGEIVCFSGLHSLLSHTKTKGGSRIKLHRELAQLLEEELHQRGSTVVARGEVNARWEDAKFQDKLIMWPPMVIIMNTMLEKDVNDKWIGMGNQELRDYFSSCTTLKAARSSYGPRGHRGISVLIFEATAVGYMDALLLNEQFSEQGRGRDAWERNPVHFYPGGIRKLYGYLAEKRDMENFNRHSYGKSRLKFEMKSYNETVWNPVMQMSENNQQVAWFKKQVAMNQKKSEALEEILALVSEKHRQTLEENKVVRLKTKMHYEENKEETEYQEQFFKDQLKMIFDARAAKENKCKKIQQEQREMFKLPFADASSTIDDYRVRAEKAANCIKLRDKDMKEFVEERTNLIRAYEERKHKLREEKSALEKQFDLELAKLTENYFQKHYEQV